MIRIGKSRDVLVVLALAFLPGELGAQSSTGLTPLIDMPAGATYQGYAGGLYPGESSTPPAAHLSEALARAQDIVPRNAAGEPDPDGVIVLLALGYSNAAQEFSVFERQADLDTTRNARVVIVNAAVRGQVPEIIKDPAAGYWTNVAARLDSMGLSLSQVQAVWLKVTDVNAPDDFPLHAQVLRDDAVEVVQLLHESFDELRLCYVSSRTYGGWSQGTLVPEPQSYETGFSVKWLIEDQIAGEAELNYDPSRGPVEAPLLLWGPYLWADGTTPRSDGMTWLQSYVEEDGFHPAATGEQIVADQLTAFFHTDVTAAPWYAGPSDLTLVYVDSGADAAVSSDNSGEVGGLAAVLLMSSENPISNVYIRFPPLTSPAPPVWSKLSLRTPVPNDLPGAMVSSTGILGWHEASITYATAPAIGESVTVLPGISRDSTVAVDVLDELADAQGQPVAFAFSTSLAQPGYLLSRQSSEPPRIVAAVPITSVPCQVDLGFAGPGSVAISMCGGPLTPGEVNQLQLTGAPPNALVYFFLGLQANPTPAEGGQFVPLPVSAVKVRYADAAGQISLLVPGTNGPFTVYLQCVAVDPSQTLGYAFSNALQIEFLD